MARLWVKVVARGPIPHNKSEEGGKMSSHMLIGADICILQVRNLPSRKVDLTINSCFVCEKRKVIIVTVLSINRIDKCHVPTIKICPLFAHKHWYSGINQNTQGPLAGTLVLIRIHKEAYLQEMNLNTMKERKVHVAEYKL